MTGDATPRVPRLRRLSDEEIELWLTVATSVTRRPGSALPDRTAPPAPVSEVSSPATAPVAPPVPPKPRPALPPMAPLERKLKQKLSRGRSTADAAIDLHGYRQDEALSALRHFLTGAQRDGLKVVLVVTGKGARGSDGASVGVLKRVVPLWLSLPEFRAFVVGFEEAARPHGGSGALYVRLRRTPLAR